MDSITIKINGKDYILPYEILKKTHKHQKNSKTQKTYDILKNKDHQNNVKPLLFMHINQYC